MLLVVRLYSKLTFTTVNCLPLRKFEVTRKVGQLPVSRLSSCPGVREGWSTGTRTPNVRRNTWSLRNPSNFYNLLKINFRNLKTLQDRGIDRFTEDLCSSVKKESEIQLHWKESPLMTNSFGV